MLEKKTGQVSIEYLIVIGFVTFIIISILGVAFFYYSNIKDKIIMTQLSNYANKIISTAESVFYAGEPSKATITAYLPKNVNQIEIIDNELVFTVYTSSGEDKIGFSSNVPISVLGTLQTSYGLKKIQIEAQSQEAVITQA